MPRAKVTQLLYSGLGGHGSVALSLLDADHQRLWVPLFGFVGIEPLLPDYADYCERRAIDYRYFPAISRRPWRVWPAIHRWLRATRPDVILLHSVGSIVPCAWYARTTRIPLVIIEHQANALKRRGDWAYSFLGLLLAERVVYLTPAYRDQVRDRFGPFFPCGKSRVIPNGIDTETFSPATKAPAAGEVRVRLGMASRFITIKRHDVLLEMMARLKALAPTISWELSLAGDGDTLQSVREAIASSGLAGCVELPGSLHGAAYVDWLRSLDLYLHASNGETLSTAILQAMAVGLPIVASEVAGIGELLAGEYGVLVGSNDGAGFALAVRALWDDPNRRHRLSQAARRRAVSEFGQVAMFARYAALLSELGL